MTPCKYDWLDTAHVDFERKVILVLGAGVTGLSIVRWLARKGAVVALADSRIDAPGVSQIRREFPEMTTYMGSFKDSIFTGIDMVVSSPGVPLEDIPLQKLQKIGVPVFGDIEIFLRENAKNEGGKVVAITGTNGKSTVTRMVERILQECGLDAVAVGNIGVPVLEVLEQIERRARKMPDVFVLEMSSFQIDTTYSFECDAAVAQSPPPESPPIAFHSG